MNAVEFVREFAVFGAKEYLAGATFYKDKLMVFTDIDDLKQIVDAFELVEFIGGDLDGAKRVYEFTKSSINISLKDRVVSVLDLKKAINLVEQCS